MNEITHNAKINLSIYENDQINSEIIADGTVTFRGSGIFIEFEENSLASAKTMIGYSEGTLTLTRMGDASYTMVMNQGESNNLVVKTPHGEIVLQLFTDAIKLNSDDSNLEIVMEYSMNAPIWDEPVHHKVSLKSSLGGLVMKS